MITGLFNPNPVKKDKQPVVDANITNPNVGKNLGTPVLTTGVSVLTDREREKLGNINFWSVENVSYPVYDRSLSCLAAQQLSFPGVDRKSHPRDGFRSAHMHWK